MLKAMAIRLDYSVSGYRPDRPAIRDGGYWLVEAASTEPAINPRPQWLLTEPAINPRPQRLAPMAYSARRASTMLAARVRARA